MAATAPLVRVVDVCWRTLCWVCVSLRPDADLFRRDIHRVIDHALQRYARRQLDLLHMGAFGDNARSDGSSTARVRQSVDVCWCCLVPVDSDDTQNAYLAERRREEKAAAMAALDRYLVTARASRLNPVARRTRASNYATIVCDMIDERHRYCQTPIDQVCWPIDLADVPDLSVGVPA